METYKAIANQRFCHCGSELDNICAYIPAERPDEYDVPICTECAYLWDGNGVETSDGQWTIGHVEGRAAMWPGNMAPPPPPEDCSFPQEGETFGIHFQGEWIVVDGQWELAEDVEDYA